MRIIFAIFFLFTFSFAYSQNKDLKFKVSASKSEVKVFPADNYLFIGGKNKIKIKVIGRAKIVDVVMQGATVKGKDSIYFVNVTGGTNAMLSVYVQEPGGKRTIALNKEYVIVPYPRANYNSVYLDSVIDDISLMGGRLKAGNKFFNEGADIISFKIPMLKDGKFVEDSVIGNRMNQNMRNYANSLKDGDIIYFEDIKVLAADKTIQTIPVLRIFVVKFGTPTSVDF